MLVFLFVLFLFYPILFYLFYLFFGWCYSRCFPIPLKDTEMKNKIHSVWINVILVMINENVLYAANRHSFLTPSSKAREKRAAP